MRKIFLVILFFLATNGFFFKGIGEVYANGEDPNPNPDKVDVYISDIAPKNVVIGESVSGTVRIEVTCSGNSSVLVKPMIDFGDGIAELIGEPCHCFTIAMLGLSGEPRKVSCDFDFFHFYNATGTYSVVPSGSWGGSVLLGGEQATGTPETIVVAEAPSPAAATSTENPLRATTTGGVIRSITNVIFYIVSALAVLLIMIGGVTILTAAGSPEQLTKGKKIILFTIIGYSLMAISRGIIALIYRILGINISP